jgi:hypothetical protein
MAKRPAVKKSLHRGSLALFEDTIGDMVINCSAALRSLLNNNNNTVLLSDFVDANGDFLSVLMASSNGKVYVFKHQYVKACITGKYNGNRLLT